MTIRLAIVGTGWAGTRHIEAISELNSYYSKQGGKMLIEVALLVDSDEAHLAETATRFGIERTANSLETALANPEIDAISIATPHAHHADAAVAAAEAGKHVAVEKPMAVTVEDADRMIDAAKQSGVKLFVTEQVAYGTEVSTLRDFLKSGKHLGEPTFATVTAGFRADDYGYPGRRAWLALPNDGGSGTWLLHGVHTVAAIRGVFGEVASVHCVESKSPSFGREDIEGTMTCTLTMESGLTVQLVQSCETDFDPARLGTTIFGTDGTLFSGRDGISFRSRKMGKRLQLNLPDQHLSDYALEFEAFAKWIAQGTKPTTSGVNERGSLAVIQAGYESAASGLPINMAERFGNAEQ